MSSTSKRDRLFGLIAELLDGEGAHLEVVLVPPLGSWQWVTVSRPILGRRRIGHVRRFGWALTLLAKVLRWTPHGELRARGSGA